MAANEIHVGDIGTVFERTITEGTTTVDISGTTLMQLIFRKPDGMLLTKTATFTTDGTDGKLRYVTISGDLSVAGQWGLQAYVEMPGGKWHTDVDYWTVHPNLN